MMLRRRLRNFGWARRCPLCCSWLRRFQPLPSFYAEQTARFAWIHSFADLETLNVDEYLCPVCGASDRDRLYAAYLRQALSSHSEARRLRVLDIAPAASLRRWCRRERSLEYRCADLYMDGVDDRVDITQMTCYADNHFDLIICSHVLEHVPDDRAATRELFRVLCPGGKGIVMVPIVKSLQATIEDPRADTEADRWRLYGQHDHLRAYSRDGFCSLLAQAGFRVDTLTKQDFPEVDFERCGIASGSVLYVVRKAAA